MNILQVIPAVAQRYGGPSSSIVSMCRALADRGVRTLLIATDADGDGRLDVLLETPTRWQGVSAQFFPRQFSEAFKYSRPLARWLNRHVGEFDVVHVHGVLSHASLAAARASARRGVPYIVRPLGTLDPWSLAQKRGRKHLLLRLCAMRLLQRAAAIQYTSAEEQRAVERNLGLSDGIVIPLGVEPSLLGDVRPMDAQRAQQPYVLALSRLHPVKNLEALIEAFAGAARTGDVPTWKLVIAGDGDSEYTARLRSLIERQGVQETVTLKGWVDGDAKRELMRGASVFAVPSLHENFGVSLVEAMAAGVPVIVGQDVHLAADVRAAETGWVVAPDAGSIETALREAMSDGEMRARKGGAAARLAARFAWPLVAGSLVALYEKLALGRAGAAAKMSPARADAIGS